MLYKEIKILRRFSFIIALSIILISCNANKLTYAPCKTIDLKIWAHSDTHIRNPLYLQNYRMAVQDIAASSEKIDMAINAGDIQLNRDNIDLYKSIKLKSGIPFWYEIAGNHDMEPQSEYVSLTGNPLHYAVKIGNMIIIFMSDETASQETDISDQVFFWWRNIVLQNRDKILITVTHAALKGSGMMSTLFDDMIIKDSERFSEVIKKYPIDIWISGHSHYAYFLKKHSIPSNFKGVLFADISSIKPGRIAPSTSYIIEFGNNCNIVTFYPRNHSKKEWINSYKFQHKLRMPFKWDKSPPIRGGLGLY